LIKAVGSDEETEIRALTTVIARIQLIDVSLPVAALAVELGAAYALRPADAVHLASAVWVGAESFVTNNKRDFRRHRIAEIDVVFPEEL
jgi:predicted nucleic acid-binding protein